jgi:hypothetical protein
VGVGRYNGSDPEEQKQTKRNQLRAEGIHGGGGDLHVLPRSIGAQISYTKGGREGNVDRG